MAAAKTSDLGHFANRWPPSQSFSDKQNKALLRRTNRLATQRFFAKDVWVGCCGEMAEWLKAMVC
jgi:hypothetical protein